MQLARFLNNVFKIGGFILVIQGVKIDLPSKIKFQ